MVRARDVRGDEPREHVVELAGVDAELRACAVDASEVVHPGQVARVPAARGAVLDGDRRTGEVAQLGEGAGLHGPAVADDRHPVAERLDLGEDVAGQQHGAAVGAQLGDDVLEDRLHQRVEARRSARRAGSSSTSEANAATSATFCRLPLE